MRSEMKEEEVLNIMQCLLDPAKQEQAWEAFNKFQIAKEIEQQPFYQFRPRLDNTSEFDQQQSFHDDLSEGIVCVIAGTGSGKTLTASHKIAKYLKETPPPDPRTPYWILSKTMEQVCGNCWSQNLSIWFNEDEIADYVWYSEKKQMPKTIILAPHHVNGHQWQIDLKSYDQGRQALQGTNIAGAWLDEQCPYAIIMEVLGRMRKWNVSIQFTLTPLEPDIELEGKYNAQHLNPTWKFYRMSTLEALKAGHVSEEFVKNLTENELAELVETRMTGAFASYAGQIFKTFKPLVHVIPVKQYNQGYVFLRGIDFGFSHPTAAVWAAKDSNGVYNVYKEYMQNKTSVEDHVAAINEGWLYGDPRYGTTYADYEDAQARHEYMLRGLSTATANKEVINGIATVQSLFKKNKLYISEACPLLIQQLKSFIWNPKKPSQDEPLKINDDLVCALRYMLHTAEISERQEQKRIPFKPIIRDPYSVKNPKTLYGR